MEIPKNEAGKNDWVEYRRLVLARLDDLAKDRDEACADREEIKRTQTQIRLDLKQLQTRATIWGGLAGFIVSALLAVALKFFF